MRILTSRVSRIQFAPTLRRRGRASARIERWMLRRNTDSPKTREKSQCGNESARHAMRRTLGDTLARDKTEIVS
jgi:hypothetical protein